MFIQRLEDRNTKLLSPLLGDTGSFACPSSLYYL
nr:MAG TPA: hypothetical protein [Caudoviricetes sp.]